MGTFDFTVSLPPDSYKTSDRIKFLFQTWIIILTNPSLRILLLFRRPKIRLFRSTKKRRN